MNTTVLELLMDYRSLGNFCGQNILAIALCVKIKHTEFSFFTATAYLSWKLLDSLSRTPNIGRGISIYLGGHPLTPTPFAQCIHDNSFDLIKNICTVQSGFSLSFLVVVLHRHLHGLHHYFSSRILPAPPVSLATLCSWAILTATIFTEDAVSSYRDCQFQLMLVHQIKSAGLLLTFVLLCFFALPLATWIY